tara:strand:- start:3122 stop:5026 length:1905 start_codon:yes stop_codon:yes gene_type:complete
MEKQQDYFKNLLSFYNIKHVFISNSLLSFSRIKKLYSLITYNPKIHKYANTLFFGAYDFSDFSIIYHHKGNRFIMFGGTDCDESHEWHKYITNHIRRLPKTIFISISDNIETRLKNIYNIKSQKCYLNLVDKNIFKPVEKKGDSIYVYCGSNTKNKFKNSVYNLDLINKIKEKLKDKYKFICSWENWANYDELPNVYSKCFIGLRLTKKDGNANTVQEFEAMNIPIVHNLSTYGLKWKNIDDIINHINECYDKRNSTKKTEDILTLNDFNVFNIVKSNINGSGGDQINERNYVENLKNNNKTVFINNEFYCGDKNLNPEITIIRDNINNNYYNSFYHVIPYKKDVSGNYFITKSLYKCLKNKHKLLVPHVFSQDERLDILNKPVFYQEQKVYKKNYVWLDKNGIKKLRKKYYTDNQLVICLSGRLAMDCYPYSIIQAIKSLRNKKFDVQLLILGEIKCNYWRLTREQYLEITSLNWVKNLFVEKKDVLSYYRICDVLAYSYFDFCANVCGSNKMKEFLLCDKPILCSRGLERENELGKNYPGFYNSVSTVTIPPLCLTKKYLNQPSECLNQYKKYVLPYLNSDHFKKEISQVINILRNIITLTKTDIAEKQVNRDMKVEKENNIKMKFSLGLPF